MDLSTCFAKVSVEEADLQSNLFKDNDIKCKERLLFLYSFLEKQGINIYKHNNIVSNIRSICGSCNGSSTVMPELHTDDLNVSIEIICSDSIIAESFVIYG